MSDWTEYDELAKMGDELKKLRANKAALEQREERLKEQLRDIPGVSLRAKISVLRLWAEPEMERRAEESRGE